MIKIAFLSSLAVLLLLACQSEKAPANLVGYWADSTGMAIFQVQPSTDGKFSISSSLGTLEGLRAENAVRGMTDLKDSFSFEVRGDSAVYSVLGVTILYHRIPQNVFDSLNKVLK